MAEVCGHVPGEPESGRCAMSAAVATQSVCEMVCSVEGNDGREGEKSRGVILQDSH